MDMQDSDSELDESQPDGAKSRIVKLIDRFKRITKNDSTKDSFSTSIHTSALKQENKELIYDFNHPKRGIAIFIINSSFKTQPERPFADQDCKKMMELFLLLDFEIRLLENKRSVDLWTSLKDIHKEIGPDCDCMACIISTHGAEVPVHTRIDSTEKPRHHILFTSDGIIPTDKVLELFNDVHCPNLQGKPRMFFIQACRSIFGSLEEDEIDGGFQVDFVYEKIRDEKVPVKMKTKRTFLEKLRGKKNVSIADTSGRSDDFEVTESHFISADPVNFCQIPCFEDYLVMFSSASEKIAWSDCGKGGWLMYCLYEVFKHLLDTDYSISLIQILTDVCGKMALDMETRTPSKPVYHRSKSAATIYHMLTKDIFLKPMAYQTILHTGPVLETAV